MHPVSATMRSSPWRAMASRCRGRKDFVGKKVGAPGIGAFLHVLFAKWLVEKGVDPKDVNFVEVTFPNHERRAEIRRGRRRPDRRTVHHPHDEGRERRGRGALRRRSRPFRARSFPTSRRALSPRKIPKSIKEFRASIEEAALIVNGDREKTNASISKFTKQPIELVASVPANHRRARAEGCGFRMVAGSDEATGHVQAPIDVSKLVAPEPNVRRPTRRRIR